MIRIIQACLFVLSAAVLSLAAGSATRAGPAGADGLTLTGWRLPSFIVLKSSTAIAGGKELQQLAGPIELDLGFSLSGEPSALMKELVPILAKLSTGRVQIAKGELSIAGIAGRNAIAQLKERIEGLKREGLKIASVQLSTLEQAPFHFTAIHPGLTRSLTARPVELSGFVPDEATRAKLIAIASGFSSPDGVFDRMMSKEAKPAAGGASMTAALSQLRALEAGFVWIWGDRFDLVGSSQSRSVETPAESLAACQTIEQAMPKGIHCDTVSITLDSGKRTLSLARPAPPPPSEAPVATGAFPGGPAAAPRGAAATPQPSKAAPHTLPRPAPPSGQQAERTGDMPSAYGGYDAPAREAPIAAGPVGAMVRGAGGGGASAELADPRVVDILYATSRKQDASAKPGMAAYSAERSQTLNYGQARVRIPDDHKTGRLELPGGYSILGIQLTHETPDQKKHFMLRSCQELTLEQWDDLVDTLGKDEALIFVHGYNNTFNDSVYRFAQIAWDLEYNGLRVLFSWASKGEISGYFYDQTSANIASEQFFELLTNLRDKHKISKVHVIAHSMGNYLVLEALRNRDLRGSAQGGRLIMAAPDVDRDQFARDIPKVQKFFRGMTLYASSNDRALVASATAAQNVRAGDVPPGGPIVMPGLESIDVSALGEEMFGLNHTTFAEQRPLIKDIALILRDGLPAPRLAEERPMPDPKKPKYWLFSH